MNDELKQFNIDINDIKESNNLIDNIHEAIHQMSLVTMKDRFEVILNNNLIEFKEKATNYRTIFGCRISYDNLPKDISFIVREDTKPSYEKLQSNWNSLKEHLEWEINDYNGNIDIETRNIDSEFLRGIAWEAQELLDKMNELE